MKNTEKLKILGILGDIRQRNGAKDSKDDSVDTFINRMSNERLIEDWCGWHLGDDSWWISMKSKFDALERMGNKNERK